MSIVGKVKRPIQRNYVRICKFREEKRKLLMVEVHRTVFGIIYLIKDITGDNMVLEDIIRIYSILNVAMEKKVDTVLSCEVIRLMQ